MNTKEAREWLITIVALGVIIYFATDKRFEDLPSGWLALLGAMLSLPVLGYGVKMMGGNGDRSRNGKSAVPRPPNDDGSGVDRTDPDDSDRARHDRARLLPA